MLNSNHSWCYNQEAEDWNYLINHLNHRNLVVDIDCFHWLLPYHERPQEEYWKHLATHWDHGTPKKGSKTYHPTWKPKRTLEWLHKSSESWKPRDSRNAAYPQWRPRRTLESVGNSSKSWKPRGLGNYVQMMKTNKNMHIVQIMET